MAAFQSVGDSQETARYRMMLELKKAVGHIRAAEDIARLEMGQEDLAQRIRDVHEHVTDDVYNGKRSHSKWARLPI